MSKEEPQSIIPYIVVKDAVKAIELYKRAFGAEQESLLRSPDGTRVMHACIRIGQSRLFITDECPEMHAHAPGAQGSSVSFYVYVADVDAVHKQALAAGLKDTMPPQDMFWGDRMGSVQDENGYKWSIATRKQVLTPEEIVQGAAAFFKDRAA